MYTFWYVYIWFLIGKRVDEFWFCKTGNGAKVHVDWMSGNPWCNCTYAAPKHSRCALTMLKAKCIADSWTRLRQMLRVPMLLPPPLLVLPPLLSLLMRWRIHGIYRLPNQRWYWVNWIYLRAHAINVLQPFVQPTNPSPSIRVHDKPAWVCVCVLRSSHRRCTCVPSGIYAHHSGRCSSAAIHSRQLSSLFAWDEL